MTPVATTAKRADELAEVLRLAKIEPPAQLDRDAGDSGKPGRRVVDADTVREAAPCRRRRRAYVMYSWAS